MQGDRHGASSHGGIDAEVHFSSLQAASMDFVPRSAVYYPHASLGLGSERILKSALLMWDQLEFIVPDEQYRPQLPNREFEEAFELFGAKKVPTDAEKDEAHERIKRLLSGHVPDAFLYATEESFRSRSNGSNTEVLNLKAKKLKLATSMLLMQLGWTGGLFDFESYLHVPVHYAIGLCVMAILADCCAGKSKYRITDEALAYSQLMNILAANDATFSTGEVDAFLSVPLKIVDVSRIPLKRLIDLRKREAKTGGTSLRMLRHNYVAKLENQARTLSELKGDLRPDDITEIQRSFEQDMADDLSALRDELRSEFNLALYSKDVITSLVAGAAALSALYRSPVEIAGLVTLTGAPVTVGGVLAARSKYLKARTEILKKHPMAYLYEARGGLQF